MIYNDLELLRIVKSAFGIPENIIELSDEDILYKLTHEVRRDFSKYHPLEKIITVDEFDMPNINSNIFVIPDSKATDIISVKEALDDQSSVLSGYSRAYEQPMTNMYDNIDQMLMMGGTSRTGSLRVKFSHPNIVAVHGRSANTIQLTLNVMHPEDFSTIPYNLQDVLEMFAKICIAESLLGIRRKYGTFQTPLGEIQLDLETINEIVNRKEEFMANERKAGNLSSRMPIYIA